MRAQTLRLSMCSVCGGVQSLQRRQASQLESKITSITLLGLCAWCEGMAKAEDRCSSAAVCRCGMRYFVAVAKSLNYVHVGRRYSAATRAKLVSDIHM